MKSLSYLTLLSLFLLANVVWSQEPVRNNKLSTDPKLPESKIKAENSTKAKLPATPLTVEKEASVMQFVLHHHAELGDLLRSLKEKNSKQYDKAVRDLYVVSERLTLLETNDPPRYALEVKLWKVQSRIQLLSAKLSMHVESELKQSLKDALTEQYDLKRELLALDHVKAKDRLQKVEKDMAEHDSRREAALSKQFELLTTASARVNNGSKPKVEPRKKDKTNSTSLEPPVTEVKTSVNGATQP